MQIFTITVNNETHLIELFTLLMIFYSTGFNWQAAIQFKSTKHNWTTEKCQAFKSLHVCIGKIKRKYVTVHAYADQPKYSIKTKISF